MEEKLQTLKSEHVHKVQFLAGELEKFKSDQAKQLREVSQLKDAFAKTSSDRMKKLKQQHEIELREVREQSNKGIETLKAELASQAEAHARELGNLKREHKSQLTALEEDAAKAQHELLTEERKKWEEQERTLQDEYSQKEEQLKNQVSVLTKDLRVSKDKLALAEQKIKELVTNFEENRADSSGLRGQLQESQQKVGALESSLASLHNELDIAREQYKQQSKEMQGISGE